jgi:hypothetical protein
VAGTTRAPQRRAEHGPPARRRAVAAAAESEAPKERGHRRGGARVPGASRLDPFADQIGKVPDGEIAKLANLSRSAVRAYRVRHGIPAFAGDEREAPAKEPRGRRSRAPKAPAPVVVAEVLPPEPEPPARRPRRRKSDEPAAATGERVWRAEWAEGGAQRSALVVAPSLAAAAQAAERRLGDKLSGVTLVGELLG